ARAGVPRRLLGSHRPAPGVREGPRRQHGRVHRAQQEGGGAGDGIHRDPPVMAAHGLFLVRMDVAHDHEATFNEVHDREPGPILRAVAGVRRASRYRQPSPTEPRYLAAYEMDSPAVQQSAAFKTAGELGRWPGEIRPHTLNRHLAVYEWCGGAPALT